MLVHELLGKSWGNALAPYMTDQFLDTLGEQIGKERETSEVYPESGKVFRAFQTTPFEDVKVIWLGQDPYNNPRGQATGLAMDCGVKVAPTIEKVLEIYQEDYPQGFPGPLYDGHLLHWAEQGVLLINAALTVRKGTPQSHLKYWQKFTTIVLDVLKMSQAPKAFVILGGDARKIMGKVPPPHYAFDYEHPVAASYDQRKWNAKGIFLNINRFLVDSERGPINW